MRYCPTSSGPSPGDCAAYLERAQRENSAFQSGFLGHGAVAEFAGRGGI